MNYIGFERLDKQTFHTIFIIFEKEITLFIENYMRYTAMS